ncbi:hypothetical protein U8557_002816 [Salmonella enterica]|nr:hypothetical protein [Salmonella enterica]EKP7536987.1 hypothetical protein [Salmonella enterica]EMB3956526.1 hypothetical protein [Salmonella enterica]EMB3959678.1 hypothetical protein [Salmonella enterica]
MNTNENFQDNRGQQESDKSGTTSQVEEYYKRWKAGALSRANTEHCQIFFDKGTEVFPGAGQELAYRLCWLGQWLTQNRHWHIEGSPLILIPQAIKFALIQQHHWLPSEIDSMTPQEISLALIDYWTEFEMDPDQSALRHMIGWQYQKLSDQKQYDLIKTGN